MMEAALIIAVGVAAIEAVILAGLVWGDLEA